MSPAAEQRIGDAETGGTPALSDEEQREVHELRQRDAEVRRHEQAHKAAAGSLAGAIAYEYTNGPDGKRYATGGEVPIDTAPIDGDPDATIDKMQRVRRAALAPAEPSNADRQVAAKAARYEQAARAEARAESGPAVDVRG